ncbi:hypothetical protein [Levilactobacillus enshiensis]|uniref:hypothetical protein n=1 Tax=Levilactobacillus enshiensis TaxID=2590213 RepID=UPI00117B9EC3|nr:hypothetical protein [Levilactobacillus enshiensis]
MKRVHNDVRIYAYKVMIKTFKERIGKTPIERVESLKRDFTQLYRTEMKLAKLEGVTVNGK